MSDTTSETVPVHEWRRATLLRRIGAAVLIGVLLVYILVPEGPRDGTMHLVHGLIPAVAAFAAALFTLHLSTSVPRTSLRLAWLLFAASFICLTVGLVLIVLRDQSLALRIGPHALALRNAIEVCFLAFYPLLIIGLLRFPPTIQSRDELLRYAVDALVVLVGGATVFLALAGDPGSPVGGLRPLLVQLAYPVGDLVALFTVATLLVRLAPGHGAHRPLLLLAAALGLNLFVNSLGPNQPPGAALRGQLPESLTVVAVFIMLAAVGDAWAGRTTGPTPSRIERPDRGALLPYAALVAGYGLLIIVAVRSESVAVIGLVVGASVLTALVVARQVLTVRDNVRRETQRAARASEERFQSLVAHSSDVITVLSREGEVLYASPSVYRRLGLTPDQLVGKSLERLVHPEDVAGMRAFLRGLLARPWGSATREWRLQGHDGQWLRGETTATNLLADPNVGGLVLNTRDVTERYVLEERLTHQAMHDELTGLANRAFLRTRLEQALRRGTRAGAGTALVFLDLDGFKSVNDTFGHAQGDSLLSAAADRLRQCVRDSDTVARLGGDEFAVLLDGGRTREEVLDAARRITSAFQTPFQIQGRELPVSASVGLVLAGPGDASGDLLRHADVAMYLAKANGRGRLEVFEPRMLEAVVGRLALQADLRRALEDPERNEFLLHYQPMISLETGRPIGMEALARWDHPTQGRISPTLFVPLAEETGLILPLGRRILNLACQDAVSWGAPHHGVHVTVNLSARQIPDPALVREVRAALTDSGLPPRHLVLEVTESAVMQQPERSAQVLAELRALGVRSAIDDFGTGYSSLSYLHQLPVDILKIDRSFLSALDRGDEGMTLIRGIVGLANGLNLMAVAEGVETLAQAAALREIGCPAGQGLLFAPPMMTEMVERWLEAGVRA